MARIAHSWQTVIDSALAGAVCFLFSSCDRSGAVRAPSIEITLVPPAAEGSPSVLEPIEGRVTGAKRGQRVVLFAQAGIWWVQPMTNEPFTAIQPDFHWKNATHPGSAYAALLVDSKYRPPPTLTTLPDKGGPVLAVATVAGRPAPATPKLLQFSGYVWEIRQMPNDPGGSRNYYDPANAWTDHNGFLHLRISRSQDRWLSAEVKLRRSLGYGSYRFVVSDVSHFEPAAVLDLSSWDDSDPRHAMDIEISRWGAPEDKNAEYVIQPYFVPANTVRFNASRGTLTYWIRWEPERVTFKTVPGSTSNYASKNALGEHVFTSSIPSPGHERIHLNLYVFANDRHPLQHETEVIVEKFEFLP